MKKRILSALLALVMVLALLPATVFAAAAETGKTSVRYYDKVQPNLLDESGQKIGPGWYYQFQMDVGNNRKETRYAKVNTGVVTGTSTSGTWYESAEAALAKGQTSFTLLSNQTISGLNRNLTVDTNGSTLNISGADMTKVTSLTVTDARYAAAQKVGDNTVSQGAVSWNLDNSGTGTQSFTLTLRNGGQLSRGVSLTNPANHTITMTDYAKIEGSVTMSGNAATNANAQNVSLSNHSTITGTVTLTGNSSRVNVASSEMGALTLKGTGTQLMVNGIISKVGAVTLNSAQSKTTGTNATVNISQGQVESITQTADDLKSNIKITVGENGSVGAIMIRNGADITVNQGSTGDITLPSGTLTVNGPSARLGALTLNGTGNTTFKVAGTGNSITSVSASNGTSLKVDIAAEISNTFGDVRLDGYKGHGIKGGTYTRTAPTADALANSGNEALIYQCVGGGSTTFYTSAQLADGLYKQVTTTGTLTIVGQDTNSTIKGVITFTRGTNEAGKLNYYGVTTIAMLPNKALGTVVATWTDTTHGNKTYNAGGSYDAPQGGGNVTLSTQGASQVVTKINGLGVLTTGDNANITASLNGNVITLSGAVKPTGGIASFQLNLLTDLVDSDTQKQVEIPVWVNYNTVNKRTFFGNQVNLTGGLTVNADGSRLTLFDGSTYYTLNGSGLRVMDENFKTDVDPAGAVKATYTGTGDAATKQYVANLIQGTLDGDTAASFDWSRSTAVKQAVNAVQAGITSSQVQNWRDQAQRKAWQNHYSGSPTKDQYTTDPVSSGYTQVWLVPYLNVTASKYNQNGTLTAALSVYYRVEVRDTNGGKPIEVQAGRALGTLGEEFGTGVVVKFSDELNKVLTSNGANNAYMRQDDTYVYKNGTGNVFTISHSGRTGLGTIVIDQTAPLVMLERSNGAMNTTHVGKGQTAYYTTLQAAVNDTQPQPKNHEDRITVLNGYKASDSIDVTGLARTFYIKAEGNTTLTRASNNFTMTPDTTGSLWTVQLAKETATGTVAIYVTDVANGNASASIVRAKAGDTVTITTNPNSGYYTLGVSAVGSNNTSIAVSGSGNSWSFKVPDNVVSVTVTPNFGVGGGQVSINVNNATNGSATVSSGTNNVTQGSTITVYTVPRAGYRATGVSVYFNNGTSVNATNTGTNTWVFTVPAGATTATVTPSFTVETGLPFTDVGSNDFYLQYVNFVYKHGMMEGFGNKYTFNGNGNVTRAQIVLILYRLSGSPSVSGVTKFSDVPANQWYSAAVAWASNNNIVNGRSNSIFDPGTAVTRQELAAILYRYNNYRGLSNGNLSNLSQFTDRGYVQSYAKEAMQWAVGNGIISGTTNTTLSPNGTAIRYQAAAMLTRYCQNFLKMS